MTEESSNEIPNPEPIARAWLVFRIARADFSTTIMDLQKNIFAKINNSTAEDPVDKQNYICFNGNTKNFAVRADVYTWFDAHGNIPEDDDVRIVIPVNAERDGDIQSMIEVLVSESGDWQNAKVSYALVNEDGHYPFQTWNTPGFVSQQESNLPRGRGNGFNAWG